MDIKAPELRELKPRIMVCGVGGAGGNAVNNMIVSGLVGVDFVVANTDAQALTSSRAERIIQMGLQVTEGLGAGSKPEIGRAAAEEALEEIRDHLAGAHMVFVTAGMGGGTGTGAAPVIARAAREMGILTVGVVTKPFHFEGGRRMRLAEGGISELHKSVDTLIIIPNQNLFRVANERTTFADAFSMADQVLYSGVACITDLMVKEGLINLDFADVRSIMSEMGKAMMGTGEATGERRAVQAAEAAISNPLLDEVSMKGARGLLISITGGNDLTLYEVDEAASRIRQEVDEEANIILGATFDSALDGVVRVSVVATGIDQAVIERGSRCRAAPPARRLFSRRSPRRSLSSRRRRSPSPSRRSPRPSCRKSRPVSPRRPSPRPSLRSKRTNPRRTIFRPRRSRSCAARACRPSTNCPPSCSRRCARRAARCRRRPRPSPSAGARCWRSSPPSASAAPKTWRRARPRRWPRRASSSSRPPPRRRAPRRRARFRANWTRRAASSRARSPTTMTNWRFPPFCAVRTGLDSAFPPPRSRRVLHAGHRRRHVFCFLS
jgi:cell division protein FtsZ